MSIELGGFAESPEVIEGTEEEWVAFNWCLAVDYYNAMLDEDFEALGEIDRNLLDSICEWLSYYDDISLEKRNDIKDIPKGLLKTCHNRTLAEAVIEYHQTELAYAFIQNGNHDINLFLTYLLYDEQYLEELNHSERAYMGILNLYPYTSEKDFLEAVFAYIYLVKASSSLYMEEYKKELLEKTDLDELEA